MRLRIPRSPRCRICFKLVCCGSEKCCKHSLIVRILFLKFLSMFCSNSQRNIPSSSNVSLFASMFEVGKSRRCDFHVHGTYTLERCMFQPMQGWILNVHLVWAKARTTLKYLYKKIVEKNSRNSLPSGIS